MKKYYDPEAEIIKLDALIATADNMPVSGNAGDIGEGETGDEGIDHFINN